MENSAHQVRLNSIYSQLPPDVRQYAAAMALKDQRSVLPLPYWSTVRILSVRAGAFTYTIDTSTRRAFAYSQGQPLDVAGFATGTIATFAETNLLKPSETLDNADVIVWGLAAELCPNSEPALAARVWREAFVELSFNGTNSFRIGTLGMFPSAGGLCGWGSSRLKAGATNVASQVDNGEGGKLRYMSNGDPLAGNFYKFPQPFTWAGVGGDGKDTSLNISVTPARTIVETAATRAAVAVVAAVTPGTIEPATAPADGALGTFVDIRFRLICVSVSKRSINT